MLVLEAWTVTFDESLAEKARFGSFECLTFGASLVEDVCFGSFGATLVENLVKNALSCENV